MRYELVPRFTHSEEEEQLNEFGGREATSFAEFARALMLGLGSVLLISMSTYLVFSWILLALIDRAF